MSDTNNSVLVPDFMIGRHYEPKAINIQAMRFLETNQQEVAEWCGGKLMVTVGEVDAPPVIVLKTLDGTIFARIGDYIIKPMEGIFSAWSANKFERLYRFLPTEVEA